MKKKQQKEYDKFVNEQFRILREHFNRCTQRCFNKYHKLNAEHKK